MKTLLTVGILLSVAVSARGAKLEDQLIEALKASEASLGTLESWQKQIFNEEMIPDSERFFRDIKSGEQSKPDPALVKDYLKFHATKFYGQAKEGPANVLVWFQSAKACDYCGEAIGPMKLEFSKRLARRGFTPVWVNAPDLAAWAKQNELSPSQFGSASHLSEMAASQKAAGSVWIEIRPTQGDEIDTAHLDEKHFKVTLDIQFLRPPKSTVATRAILQTSSGLEVREQENATSIAKRLLMDAMGEIGSQTDNALALLRRTGGQADVDSEERLVEINGLTEYGTLLAVTEGLERLTGDPVVLRKLSRGKAEFLLLSQKPKEDLKKRISAWSQDRTLAGTQADLKTVTDEGAVSP